MSKERLQSAGPVLPECSPPPSASLGMDGWRHPFFFPPEDMLVDFRKRRRAGEGKKPQRERETSIVCLLYVPQLGTEPAVQACAPTKSQTRDLWCFGMSLQPIEPHWLGLEVPFVGWVWGLSFRGKTILSSEAVRLASLLRTHPYHLGKGNWKL